MIDYDRLLTAKELLEELVENFSLPRGKKNVLRKYLKIIEEVHYTTDNMIELEYRTEEIIEIIEKRNLKSEKELLEKLKKLYETVRRPEIWC